MRVPNITTMLTLGAFLTAPWAAADAPPGPYFNGFETDTAGWFNYSGAAVTRVPTGSSSAYANESPRPPGTITRDSEKTRVQPVVHPGVDRSPGT
jgi:hypothetical protein